MPLDLTTALAMKAAAARQALDLADVAVTGSAADIADTALAKIMTGAERGKLHSIVSVADFGGVGDYNPQTNLYLTDNSAAFDAAFAVSTAVFLPEGHYYVSQSSTHRLIESRSLYGPGRVWGPYFGNVRAFGRNLLAGVSSTEIGNELPGGFIFGGENGKGIRAWAQTSMWMQFQPQGAGMPLEIQAYTSSLKGAATPVVGTNRLLATYGAFTLAPDWADGVQLVRAGDLIGFGDEVYKILSRVSDTEITVMTETGGAVSFSSAAERPFRHVYQYSYGTCNVSGTTVVATGDKPFNVGVTEAGQSFLCINGTWYSATVSSTRSATLGSAAGVLTGARFVQKDMDPHRSSTIFRIQGLAGSYEECFSWGLDIRGRALLDLLGTLGGTNLVFRADGSYDASGSEEHFMMGRDGRFAFGKAVDPAYAGRMESFVYSQNALTGGGVSRSDFLRLRALFNGGGTRRADFYFLNDFHGLSIQSRDAGATAVATSLSPDGGGVSIGYRGDVIAAGLTLSVAGVIGPSADNAYSLALPGQRFSVVHAATGTIATSDARTKTDIQASDLGLAFINALQPVRYRFSEGGSAIVEEEIEELVDEPVTIEDMREVVGLDVIDGCAVETRRMEPVTVPVYDELPVFDAEGNPVLESFILTGDDGTPVRDEHGGICGGQRPKVHRVQRMQQVTRVRRVARMEPVEGRRTHYGLVAQQVKSVVDALGIDDFAGWTLADVGDPESLQGLRYEQFIAPLIAAVQELSRRVKALEDGAA